MTATTTPRDRMPEATDQPRREIGPDKDGTAASEGFTHPDQQELSDQTEAQNNEPVTKAPRDTEFAGHPEFSQDAAANTPPDGIGNSEPVEDVDEKTRHSDGINPRRS